MELRLVLIELLKSALGGKTIELPMNSDCAIKTQSCDAPIKITSSSSDYIIKIQFCDEAIEVIADRIRKAIKAAEVPENDPSGDFLKTLGMVCLAGRISSGDMRGTTPAEQTSNLSTKVMEEEPVVEDVVDVFNDQTPISALGLFKSTEEKLNLAGIYKVGKLTELSDFQLLGAVDLPFCELEYIIRRLREKGLELKPAIMTDWSTLEEIRALPIKKLDLANEIPDAEAILERNGVRLFGDLLILSTFELLLLDPELSEDDADWIEKRLARLGLELTENNFFADENLAEMTRDVAIEKLFPDGVELQALKGKGIDTINQLLNLSMEELFELLEDDRDVIWGILERLKTKGFNLRRTEHILGMSIAEAYQKMPISDQTEQLLSHEFYVDTVGELICRPQSSLCSKWWRLSQARLKNLRFALLEEGLYLNGDAEWAKQQRALRDMSLEEIRALPISRMLFEGYAKRTMTTIGIKTVGELLDYSEDELRQHKDAGDKTMEVILFHLKCFGLELKDK